MQYISTRGDAPAVNFNEALLRGLAPDGGLYIPQLWPRFSKEEIAAFADLDFVEAATRILTPYVGDCIAVDELRAMARAAYGRFDHSQTCPLQQFGDEDYLLELFHGPTLAFKDVAMQLLGQLFAHVLERLDRRVTIIGATSGDTGAAAIEAFRGQERADIFILHPKGRVSEVQRRIMTSVDDPAVHNIAIEGDFDDCQRIVKELFGDHALADQLSLGGVNSINWVRLAIQIVYYFTAASQLKSLDRPLSFTVPTGNFGDVFAGYAAKKMGLPVDKLCIAVNENDILYRTLQTGTYAPRQVVKTSSPSMDIQVASNFERLVFEATARDAAATSAFAKAVARGEDATLPAPALDAIRQDFIAYNVDEQTTSAEIAAYHKAHNTLIDPHTAVAVSAMRQARTDGTLKGKVVTLSTAHPAKFPEVVQKATGEHPSLPGRFADLYQREEHCLEAENSTAAIKEILLSHARATGASAR